MSAKVCPQCGFEIIKNANYCFNCGLALKFPMPEIKYLNTEVSETEEGIQEPSPTENENIVTSENPIIELPENSNETQPEEEQAFQLPESDESETPEECEEPQPQESDDNDIIFGSGSHESVEESEQNESNDNEDSAERKGIRILGMSEGVFYTTLLAIGISAVVVFKWINDPDWLRGSSNDDKPLIDTSVVNSPQKDTISDTTSNNITEISSLGITSIGTENVNTMPNPSGTDTDSAYHVIISALKDIEHARQVASSVKYPDTHIISDEKTHKVAVFRSLRKEDAKLYMDSVVKKDYPDAWLFHGTAK